MWGEAYRGCQWIITQSVSNFVSLRPQKLILKIMRPFIPTCSHFSTIFIVILGLKVRKSNKSNILATLHILKFGNPKKGLGPWFENCCTKLSNAKRFNITNVWTRCQRSSSIKSFQGITTTENPVYKWLLYNPVRSAFWELGPVIRTIQIYNIWHPGEGGRDIVTIWHRGEGVN